MHTTEKELFNRLRRFDRLTRELKQEERTLDKLIAEFGAKEGYLGRLSKDKFRIRMNIAREQGRFDRVA